uniref:Uncharacterized protein n=1 Tax=Sphaerodactylus townsendi TaxID=933632 RepID=A0ACB8FQH5_9SAUR
MAAGWLLVLSLTLFHSLVVNLSAEGPFPSASTVSLLIATWMLSSARHELNHSRLHQYRLAFEKQQTVISMKLAQSGTGFTS